MHKTCQKQTHCKATLLNMHAAEIACRKMQNMIETHAHCLSIHTLTWPAALYSTKNGCWNWQIGKMQKLVPNYGQNMSKQKCARGQWSKQKCARVDKMCTTPPLLTRLSVPLGGPG